MNAVTLEADQRLLLPGEGSRSLADLADHLTVHGTLHIPSGDRPNWTAGILAAIERSGLLGRGGAGFPTAAKWHSARRGSRSPLVVVNAMEGEPASIKDRVLLTHAPHLVLDGAEVAAAVVGASEIVVCVPDHAGLLAASVEAAVAQRAEAGGRRPRVRVQRPPGRYVTGEESALIGWLDRRRALPVLRIDKSVPLRVGDARRWCTTPRHWPRWPSSPATVPSGSAGWAGRMPPGRRWSPSAEQ